MSQAAQLSLAAPALLPLAALQAPDGAACLLGLTLQHPPISLLARPAQDLLITGARADLANALAHRFLAYHNTPSKGEIEIELAIPRAMGLGSDLLIGLSVARVLAALHGLPGHTAALAAALGSGPADGLLAWGFDQGGLLLVEAQAATPGMLPILRRRQPIAHPAATAWALVLVLPRSGPEIPDGIEAERLARLLTSAPSLGDAGWRLLDEALWPAVEHDDLEAFGEALGTLLQLNQQALAASGTVATPSAEQAAVLEIMRRHRAVAYGYCPTGLGLFALVRGDRATIDLRNDLREQLGFFSGTVMATITDNRGASLRQSEHSR